MSKVLTETNVSELLKISAGEDQVLRQLIEDFERRVTSTFEEAEGKKEETSQPEQASSAAAGSS
ncbi:MAG TPA: hypothetical protein VGK82_09020 [Pyrinomonadaceae bacterium]